MDHSQAGAFSAVPHRRLNLSRVAVFLVAAPLRQASRRVEACLATSRAPHNHLQAVCSAIISRTKTNKSKSLPAAAFLAELKRPRPSNRTPLSSQLAAAFSVGYKQAPAP